MRYRKTDVQTRGGNPAVDVKVRGYWRRVPLPLDLGSCDGVAVKTHPAFTHDAAEPFMESHGAAAFECICQDFWEMVQDQARDFLKRPVRVYSEGRSGGWAVVHGLPDVDTWNAVDLARWRRFELWCEAQANDAPRAMLEWVYFNAWDPNSQHLEAEAAERVIAEGGVS